MKAAARILTAEVAELCNCILQVMKTLSMC